MIQNPNYTTAGFNYAGFSGNQFSWSQCDLSPYECPDDGNVIAGVLVKFDLFNVLTTEYGANLTGLYANVTYPEPNYGYAQYDMSGSGIDIQSGDVMSATVNYNGSTLTESLTDTVTSASFTISYKADIPALLRGATAYVGFGGGTGDSSGLNTYIQTWSYSVARNGGAATPTFSPVAGSYAATQSVNLKSASSGAVICYSTTQQPATDGSTGCSAGMLYTGPVSISNSEALFAVAGGTGYNDSSTVGAATYIIDTQTTVPIHTLPSGGYTFPQSLVISANNTGLSAGSTAAPVTSYCTTAYGGTCTPGTAFLAPITITSAETVCSDSTWSHFSRSATVCYNYAAAAPPASSPSFSPGAGAYTGKQSVTIATSSGGVICYSTTGVPATNGTTGCTSGTLYGEAIAVPSSETLQAVAGGTGYVDSPVVSASYVIQQPAATPGFSPPGGSYTSPQMVTISDTTSGAMIYYTIDGSKPSASSTLYTGPVTISSTSTLQAIAAASGDANSAVGSAAYTITQSPASTATMLTVSATQVAIGQSVVFSAKVVPQAGKGAPAGSVKFFDGTASLGRTSLNGGGSATFSTTGLAVGTHSITASYFGGGGDSSSVSGAVSVVVTQGTVATTTTLTASAGQIAAGQSVMFTATVAPQSGSNVPTDNVTFWDGSTSLGSGTLNASGVATLSTNSLSAGTQSVTAFYGGDSKDNSSVSNAVSVVVTQTGVATTTMLTASATQVNAGQSVTFIAKVLSQSGKVPAGSVKFFDGTTSLAKTSLNASGTATFSTGPLGTGTHSITASYFGGSQDSSSISQAVSVVVE